MSSFSSQSSPLSSSSSLRQAETVVLVHCQLPHTQTEDTALITELAALARTAGLVTLHTYITRRHQPDPQYFVGKGKLEEIREYIAQHPGSSVIFNHALSPGQERNISRALCCHVLDRITLILAIFAQRAQTFEGKLQVELAQLTHLSTRLVRGWTHLERQKGGIGLRGPGEKQLETDRRLIRKRIKAIEKRIKKVQMQRQQGRQSRKRIPLPTVALVGYTNAGKSTLFQQLTKEKHTHIADQLFATLDPKLRRITIPEWGECVLADTVGFIRQLPHTLITAFSATLEEVRQASLLLHVVHANSPEKHSLIQSVNDVLHTIHADHIPQLLVYNQIDQLPHATAHIDHDETGHPTRVWVSALTGEGMTLLYHGVSQILNTHVVIRTLLLPVTHPHSSRIRAQCYALQCVLSEEVKENGDCKLTVRIAKTRLNQLLKDNHIPPCPQA